MKSGPTISQRKKLPVAGRMRPRQLPLAPPASYEEIVARYRAEHLAENERHLRLFAIQKSLDVAVNLAARARSPTGRKFRHQWRIPNRALAQSAEILLARLDALQGAAIFEGLYDVVDDLIASIRGISDLTVYDTALRIGAYLGKYPSRVYLHRGTRAGAAGLRLETRRRWLDPGELPPAFQSLEPWQMEDCLCIYKAEIAAVTQRQHHM